MPARRASRHETLQTPCTYSMDTKMSEDVLCAIAKLIVTWESLRPYLGLSLAEEEIIKNNNRKYEEQKKALLYRWCDNMGEGATPRHFISAALEAENKELADEVKRLVL